MYMFRHEAELNEVRAKIANQFWSSTSMSDFSDFIVYADESGDHGMARINLEYPVFALAFLRNQEARSPYRRASSSTVQVRHLGHDSIILHEHDIRKAIGPFGHLRSIEQRSRFFCD